MVQMLLIRCILGARSFRSMIFMGDLCVVWDKFVEYYVNVCIIGGGIWNCCTFVHSKYNKMKLQPTRIREL